MSAQPFEQILESLRANDLVVHDCHAHIGPAFNFANTAPAADHLIRTMDLAGVQTAFVSALLGMADEVLGNAALADAAARYPDRIRPVPVANPNHGRATLGYLERCRTDSRIAMLKVHPTLHEYPASGPAYGPIFDLAGHSGWLVLSHTWSGGPDPGEFAELARRHPKTTFILGHSGGVLPGIRAAVEVARSADNVYLDLACSIPYDGVLEWMVNQLGDERILFGTDATFFDPRPQFGRVVMARISSESKRRILGANLGGIVSRLGPVRLDAPGADVI